MLPERLEQLYRAHYDDMVYNIGYQLRDNSIPFVEAHDIVQEAFMKLYRISKDDNPLGYLYAIARNKIRDLMRKQKKEDSRKGGLYDADTFTLPAIDTALEFNIYKAIETLNPRPRQYFSLLFKGYQPYEIAKKMKISTFTGSAMRTQAINEMKRLKQVRPSIFKN